MRLTHRDKYGRWCSDGSKASLQLGYEDYPSILRGDAVDKLAAYEDTGLEPEAIDGLKQAIFGMVAAEIGENQGFVEVSRAKEIAYAEEEGRLVILPCKVGDTVFVITERGFIAKDEVRNFRFFDKLIVDVEYHHFGTCATSRYWGETVFLTREEAEAALKRGQDDA